MICWNFGLLRFWIVKILLLVILIIQVIFKISYQNQIISYQINIKYKLVLTLIYKFPIKILLVLSSKKNLIYALSDFYDTI
jgi:hypothetical protein